MEGVWWAIGALFTLVLALFGYIWQVNSSLKKDVLGLKDSIAKQGERITRQEALMEPLREITMMAVPKMLNLRGSGDVLEDAFTGPPEEAKLDKAECRIRQELEKEIPNERLLPLALAQWLLKVRRHELSELKQKEALK